MNYAAIQSNITSILNRRDVTFSQLTLFIQMAVQRIQRNLRVPAMEKTVSFTMDGTGTVPVPGDMLEVISIFTNDDVNQDKLVKVDLQSAILASHKTGIAKVYHRNGGNFVVGPVPNGGTALYINYYADAGDLSGDTDHNWITDASPDLLIYGALTRAADYFMDDRKQLFEQTYLQIEDDLRQMALQDELVNASIMPAYDTNTQYYQSGW